jgi:PKD repeat protein
MTTVSRTRLALLAVLALSAACTVQQAQIPSLTGPSEFALSISVTATPDTLNRDGASQSSIVLTARGPDGNGLAGVAIRLDMAINNVMRDFGTLSAKNLVTGSDGRAVAIYTAPPPPPQGATGTTTTLTILATPQGSNAQASVTHSAEIRLVPVGVILPPEQSAGPRFTFSPSEPEAFSPVQFDASASCAGPVSPSSDDPCPTGHGVIVDYLWNFGDGSTAHGRVASHTFDNPQTYGVTLTVTNDLGGTGSLTQAVPVGAGEPPTADFVFSPSAPLVGQEVQFNASAARAAPGRTLVEFIWNWGDGDDAEGMLEEHQYSVAGAYTVTLTVVDDVGQQGTIAKTVTVGTVAAPTADFVFSPTAPVVGQNVNFNASASSAAQGQTIVSYAWDFGDDDTGSGKTPTHDYELAGTYSVTLTVTDSAGNKAVATKTVTVGAGSPIANFTISPTPPVTAGTELTFDGSSSQAFGGADIEEYSWSWGDLTPSGGGPTPSHTFVAAGTYTVTLTVTDSEGRIAQLSKSVTIQ